MNTTKNISIHRHAGNVALAFEGVAQTVYLSQDQAAWLRNRLLAAVQDIEQRDFSRSRFGPAIYISHETLVGPEFPFVAPPAGKEFFVVAVSTNTNSFGLKSIVLLARDGEGWEVLKSAYSGEALPKQGDTVRKFDGRFDLGSYECPRQLSKLSPLATDKVLKETGIPN